MRSRIFLGVTIAVALGLSACTAGHESADIRPDLGTPPAVGTAIAPAATAAAVPQ
jgi:hypothetical protein